MEPDAMSYIEDFTHCCMETDAMVYITDFSHHCIETETKNYIPDFVLFTTTLGVNSPRRNLRIYHNLGDK